MIILSFINGKVVKNSPLCKSCTDPVTYLNFPFQSNSVCQCPFFKKIFSHTHSSNYSRPLEFPSVSLSWGSPTPSISIPKFSPHFSSYSITQPKNSKSWLKDRRTGWKKPSGRVNSFFHPFCFIWI